MIFGHAVIAWIFFLIFYYCKILNFGLLKVRFRRKKQKDVKDDGNLSPVYELRVFSLPKTTTTDLLQTHFVH